MEHLRHVAPGIKHSSEAIEYINEHLNCNSPINGVGSLNRYLNNYQAWLEKLRQDRLVVANEERVPSETYFLERVEDHKIIGMVNIRLSLNERLLKCGGHIGYGIRPSERRKGYNKINLYLALLRCQELGIEEVILDCNQVNLASSKTMEALGGIRIASYYNEEEQCNIYRYLIKVNESLNNNRDLYEPKILKLK